jgi:hypothetical protein
MQNENVQNTLPANRALLEENINLNPPFLVTPRLYHYQRDVEYFEVSHFISDYFAFYFIRNKLTENLFFGFFFSHL